MGDLLPWQVAHLCAIYREDPDADLSEESMRSRFAEVKYDGDEEADSAQLGIERDLHLNLKLFKKLLRSIARAMRIDETFVIIQFIWVSLGRFELPPALGRLLFET